MIRNLATKIEVLEEERHTRVEQIKETTFYALIVDKFIFVCADKTSHPQPKLWIFLNVVREKHYSTICGHSFIQKFPFSQSLLYRGSYSTCRDTSTLNTQAYASSYMLLIQVGKRYTISRLSFP